jgi:hypothetical protein
MNNREIAFFSSIMFDFFSVGIIFFLFPERMANFIAWKELRCQAKKISVKAKRILPVPGKANISGFVMV